MQKLWQGLHSRQIREEATKAWKASLGLSKKEILGVPGTHKVV